MYYILLVCTCTMYDKVYTYIHTYDMIIYYRLVIERVELNPSLMCCRSVQGCHEAWICLQICVHFLCYIASCQHFNISTFSTFQHFNLSTFSTFQLSTFQLFNFSTFSILNSRFVCYKESWNVESWNVENVEMLKCWKVENVEMSKCWKLNLLTILPCSRIIYLNCLEFQHFNIFNISTCRHFNFFNISTFNFSTSSTFQHFNVKVTNLCGILPLGHSRWAKVVLT